ncbi:MAG: HTH domain-containing protein [Chloroflexi bacterium]|nr:HTH domain-containing protein [Chloroflexota bacterium]
MIERRAPGFTRQSIMQLLRRHGAMTAQELSDALHVGAVGVRQHLALLERDGQVCVTGVRRSIGRPSHLYALTSAADECFPRRYEHLALDLLASLETLGGATAVEQVLTRRREELARELAPRLAGKDRAGQIAALADLLAEQGYMCEWEQLDDGSFTLTEYNCPVDCVARRHDQLCAQELRLYEDLLGTPIARESTIVAGAHCCRYHIPAWRAGSA